MQKEKKRYISSIIIVIILIIALIIIAILYINTSTNTQEGTFEKKAKDFCNQNDIDSVSICNGQVIQIKSKLLGAGSTYHHRDGTTFSCPIISPQDLSPECKAVFNAEQTNQWNCEPVC